MTVEEFAQAILLASIVHSGLRGDASMTAGEMAERAYRIAEEFHRVRESRAQPKGG